MKRCLFLALSILALVGCNEYWWSRGKPERPEALRVRALSRLEQGLKAGARPDIAPIAGNVRQLVEEALSELAGAEAAAKINGAKDQFLGLEGKLSLGSRAPFGELSGQFRVFGGQAERGEPIFKSAFDLFAARLYFLLADELGVPPPAG